MALPTSRPRTYLALSQLIAADLNSIFDSIIALHTGKCPIGPRRLEIDGRLTAGTATFAGDGTFTIATQPFNLIMSPLPLTAGERLIGLRARIDPAAAGSVTLELHKVTDGTPALLASAATSGAALQTITTTPLASEIVPDSPGVFYLATFIAVTTGHEVLGGCIDVVIPP